MSRNHFSPVDSRRAQKYPAPPCPATCTIETFAGGSEQVAESQAGQLSRKPSALLLSSSTTANVVSEDSTKSLQQALPHVPKSTCVHGGDAEPQSTSGAGDAAIRSDAGRAL